MPPPAPPPGTVKDRIRIARGGEAQARIQRNREGGHRRETKVQAGDDGGHARGARSGLGRGRRGTDAGVSERANTAAAGKGGSDARDRPARTRAGGGAREGQVDG